MSPGVENINMANNIIKYFHKMPKKPSDVTFTNDDKQFFTSREREVSTNLKSLEEKGTKGGEYRM